MINGDDIIKNNSNTSVPEVVDEIVIGVVNNLLNDTDNKSFISNYEYQNDFLNDSIISQKNELNQNFFNFEKEIKGYNKYYNNFQIFSQEKVNNGQNPQFNRQYRSSFQDIPIYYNSQGPNYHQNRNFEKKVYIPTSSTSSSNFNNSLSENINIKNIGGNFVNSEEVGFQNNNPSNSIFFYIIDLIIPRQVNSNFSTQSNFSAGGIGEAFSATNSK
jgi:hypothetical protein